MIRRINKLVRKLKNSAQQTASIQAKQWLRLNNTIDIVEKKLELEIQKCNNDILNLEAKKYEILSKKNFSLDNPFGYVQRKAYHFWYSFRLGFNSSPCTEDDVKQYDNKFYEIIKQKKGCYKRLQKIEKNLAILSKSSLSEIKYNFMLAVQEAKTFVEESSENARKSYNANFNESLSNFKEETLHMAAFKGHDIAVQWLIDAGADSSVKNEQQNTPLHIAAFTGHSDVVKVLLCDKATKAKLNDVDEDGNTALHKAVYSGNNNVVKLLLDVFRKEDINIQNTSHDVTALHIAILQKGTNIAASLLDAGADLEVRDLEGYSALHLASFMGNSDMVKVLLDHGVDITAECPQGRTALDMAESQDHDETSELLSNALDKRQNFESSESFKQAQSILPEVVHDVSKEQQQTMPSKQAPTSDKFSI